MALLYGNPNQITFTFDATYNSIGEMDTDAANIMLGRFVLWQDNTNGLSHIYMRRILSEESTPEEDSPHTKHYQHIGIVPVISVDQSTITGLSLDIDARQVDNSGDNNEELKYTLELHTTIKTATKTWDAGTKQYKTTINTQEYYDSVDITFADSDEINFYTDADSNIKLGIKKMNGSKIIDGTLTANKIDISDESIQLWYRYLSIDSILNGDISVGKAKDYDQVNGTIKEKFASLENNMRQLVQIEPAEIENGTKIATIIINGNENYLYAPQGGGTGDVTKEDLEKNYYNKDYIDNNLLTTEEANKNYILKNEAYGSLTFTGFDIYNANSEDNLYVIILNNIGEIEIVLSHDQTYKLSYGQYIIGRATYDNNTNFILDNTYPTITVDVGYKSSETINVADWASYNFESNSWSRINYICEQGLADQYWNLGDMHSVMINDNQYYLQIIGFNHDSLSDDETKTANMTLQLGFNTIDIDQTTNNLYNKLFVVTGYKNVNFWNDISADSMNIKNTLTEIAVQLESNNIALKECIKSCYDLRESAIIKNKEKISLPAEIEVLGNNENSFSVSGEGEQYEFFKNNQQTYIKYFSDAGLQESYKTNGHRQIYRSPGYKDGVWQITCTYYQGYGSGLTPSSFNGNKSVAICPLVYI